MRKVQIFCMILAVAVGTLMAQTGKIPVSGTDRDYLVYTPTGLADNAPLILALHALGQSNTQFRSSSGWDKIADREKFTVVYPVGITTVNMQGMNLIGWDISGDSDVKFLTALIDTMAARYKINRKRVYSTGFSMGGMMSYVLACRESGKIAAIGPDGGFPVGQNASSCKPSVPVPLCHVHGGMDDFVKYTELPPWIKKFAEVNGCQSAPTTTQGDKYTKDDYTPCENGNSVLLYTVKAMKHSYATLATDGFSATDTFWAFFSKHPGTITGVAEPIAATNRSQDIRVEFHATTIFLSQAEMVSSVNLFDMTGRMVARWNAPKSRTLSVGSLPKGVYLLSVAKSSGGNLVRRFSIE